MKILNKFKHYLQVKAYRILFKRELKKYNDNKVSKAYCEVVDCLNGKIKTTLPLWKVKVARDCLVKEVKKRNLL